MGKELGRKIQGFRLDLGLRARELAKATGIDATTISKIEAGGRGPTEEQRIALARVFGVDPSQLIDGASDDVMCHFQLSRPLLSLECARTARDDVFAGFAAALGPSWKGVLKRVEAAGGPQHWVDQNVRVTWPTVSLRAKGSAEAYVHALIPAWSRARAIALGMLPKQAEDQKDLIVRLATASTASRDESFTKLRFDVARSKRLWQEGPQTLAHIPLWFEHSASLDGVPVGGPPHEGTASLTRDDRGWTVGWHYDERSMFFLGYEGTTRVEQKDDLVAITHSAAIEHHRHWAATPVVILLERVYRASFEALVAELLADLAGQTRSE